MSDSQEPLLIRPAATVAVVRDSGDGIELLMLRRNRELAFAGGAWVFPGGAVEVNETPVAAAVRECVEECGIHLPESALVEYAHWTTPTSGMSRRFATHFYCAQVDTAAQVKIDEGEIHEYHWTSAKQALAQHHRGEFKIMPPTYLSLILFGRYANCAELLAALDSVEPYRVEPKIVRAESCLVSLYPGDSGFDQGVPVEGGAVHRCWFYPEGFSYQHSGADVGWRAMDRCE
ncbi:MAG: NUDIX hydrolase [Porticoccaceae bacterium]